MGNPCFDKSWIDRVKASILVHSIHWWLQTIFLCLQSKKCKNKKKKLFLKNVVLYFILKDVLETIMIIKRINEAKNKAKQNKNLWHGPLRMEVEWNGADINPLSVAKETAPKLESGKRLRREQTPPSIHNRVQTTCSPDQQVKQNEISHKAGLSSSRSRIFALCYTLNYQYHIFPPFIGKF